MIQVTARLPDALGVALDSAAQQLKSLRKNRPNGRAFPSGEVVTLRSG